MAHPLDTDVGTELFKHYETEYQLVQADLVQKLDQIAELSGEPRKAALSSAERALEETGELLDQMQMEKQNVPSSQRSAINRRLRDYKTDVDGYQRKLRTLADDRSALFGGRYTDNPGSSAGDAHLEQRQQLLAGGFLCRHLSALGRKGLLCNRDGPAGPQHAATKGQPGVGARDRGDRSQHACAVAAAARDDRSHHQGSV